MMFRRSLALMAALALLVSVSGDPTLSCSTNEGQLLEQATEQLMRTHGYIPGLIVPSLFYAAESVEAFLIDLVNNATVPGLVVEPLRFAFYADDTDAKGDCRNATSGPFITSAGSEACEFLSATADLSGVATYLRRSIGPMAPLEWSLIKQYVDGIGANKAKAFEAELGSGVYTPPNVKNIQSIPDIAALSKLDGLFSGTSGGGGSGFGWELNCVTQNPAGGIPTEDTLLSGGGGGGAGYSSPFQGIPNHVDGGGGGGMQLGPYVLKNFPDMNMTTAMVGAGSQKSRPVQTNDIMNLTAWNLGMYALPSMFEKCLSDPSSAVVLRGGGGGGAGFEVYQAFNVSDPTVIPQEYTPHPVSFGYGFQFVTTVRAPTTTIPTYFNRLINNLTTPSGPTFAMCPANTNQPQSSEDPLDCDDFCMEPVSSLPSQQETVHLAYNCAPQVAADICALAVSVTGQSYGRYQSYLVCNQILIHDYLEAVLPAEDRQLWAWLTAYGQVYPGMPPPISSAMVKAHAEDWCPPPPPGCLQYPACSI